MLDEPELEMDTFIRESRQLARDLRGIPEMVDVLMTSIAQIVRQDIRDAITRNSSYREESARQWARRAASRAFEFYPHLR